VGSSFDPKVDMGAYAIRVWPGKRRWWLRAIVSPQEMKNMQPESIGMLSRISFVSLSQLLS
jgi:hypothetical protein